MTAVRMLGATVLIVAGLLAAGQAGAEPKGELAVYAGAVISNNPDFDSLVMVEFPFSLNRDEFTFFDRDSLDGGLYARVFAQVDLLDTAGFAIDSVRTYFSLKVNSPDEARIGGFRIFNKLVMMVRPGRYAARLIVIDVASKARGDYFFDELTVTPSDPSRLTIGGACLAYNLVYVGKESPSYNPRLYKNGFHVTVNPVSIFARSDTLIYVYGEIYNLTYEASAPSDYRIALRLTDANGVEVENMGGRIARKPGESAVITESFGIAGWKTGGYKVEIVAGDLQSGQADTAILPFSIVSTQALLAAASGQRRTQQQLEEGLTVDDHVNMVKYLVTAEQLAILEGLSAQGKMNYLDGYWKEHDVNRATGVVENRIEMIRRYKYANKFFSTNNDRTDGWSTDRGRIYLTYGVWDERDEYQAPRIGNPFEIWHYRSIREGKFFLFEDWSGNDDYRLVHSNVSGEVYSRGWQEQIDQGYIDLNR
ncbi:MAG: GWxTD domain-containing protein [Candidatus Zixiibacteriota bacterium]|nr:MAG: GWxTD domain-containing protein [candidate division Zixibacteria bacterium]